MCQLVNPQLSIRQRYILPVVDKIFRISTIDVSSRLWVWRAIGAFCYIDLIQDTYGIIVGCAYNVVKWEFC